GTLLPTRTLRATLLPFRLLRRQLRLCDRVASTGLQERVASARQDRQARRARFRPVRLVSRVNAAPPRPAILLRLADTVQDLRQSKIDLPALHVHLDDLHGDPI